MFGQNYSDPFQFIMATKFALEDLSLAGMELAWLKIALYETGLGLQKSRAVFAGDRGV